MPLSLAGRAETRCVCAHWNMSRPSNGDAMPVFGFRRVAVSGRRMAHN